MKVYEALLKRKSIRAYIDKPIDKSLIDKILFYARNAPSGTNIQHWDVAVVSGKTKKILDETLLKLFLSKTPKKFDYDYYPLTELPLEYQKRRIECGKLLYETLNIKKTDVEERLKQWSLNYSAFGAPTVLFFFINEHLEKGAYIDYGMFLQSIMLMAVELGLATCAQASLAEYPLAVKEILSYSSNKILLCGMALGYEDESAKINKYKTPRENIENFTKFFN